MKHLSTFLIPMLMSQLFVSPAPGCTCAQYPEVADALAQSAAVFIGTVIRIELLPKVLPPITPEEFLQPGGGGRDLYFENLRVLVTFQIDRSWKGSARSEVAVRTGYGTGDCGYRFEIAGKYLVYAYDSHGKLTTDICRRTAAVDCDLEDLKILDKLLMAANDNSDPCL